MKRLLIAAVFAVAGLAAFAGTCTITHISLTTIGTHDTFAGQLDNNSGVDILQHNFVVAFLDANNNVVEVKTVSGCLRSIQNGKTDFFSAASSASASTTTTGLARLAFDSTFKVGTVVASDLTISNVNVRRDGDTLRVSGTVKNNSSDTVANAVACIVVFNNAGNVVVTSRANVDDTSLAQNQTGNFDKSITVPDNAGTVDHVDIYVDGLDGDSNGTPVAPEASKGHNVNICATPTNTATNTATFTPTTTPSPTATPTNTPVATNTPVPTHTPCP